MFSSAWVETPTTLLFNEASIYNAAGQVVTNDVARVWARDRGDALLCGHRSGQKTGSSIPVPAYQRVVLSGKAAFKG